jgi:hypothetical protein
MMRFIDDYRLEPAWIELLQSALVAQALVHGDGTMHISLTNGQLSSSRGCSKRRGHLHIRQARRLIRALF